MLDVDKIKKELKNNLSKYRYEHSIRVAEEASKLAKHYGCNEIDAYIAGLLHDIAKEYSIEENKRVVSKYKLNDDLLDDKNICHAEIGSVVAKEIYNVNDNICQSIRYHNIGNKNMTLLDKIIFVADKIESGKSYLGIEDERKMAYIDIDKALLLCLINNKKKLEQENKSFNKESEELLNYLYLKYNN